MRRLLMLLALLLGGSSSLSAADCADKNVAQVPESHARDALTLVKSLFPYPEDSTFDKPRGVVPDIVAIEESPDARFLALGDNEGNVFLWDRSQDRVAVVHNQTLHRPDDGYIGSSRYRVEDIRFCGPDVLCWLTGDGSVWRAEIKDGRVASKKRLYRKPLMWYSGAIVGDSFIRSVEYANATGNPLYFLLRPWVYVLQKYSLKTGRLEGTCEIYPRKAKYYHEVNAMAVSPDEKLLAIASENNCGIVSIEPFKLVRAFGIEWVKSLAFSPDGSRLALASRHDCEVFVYDVPTGRLLQSIRMPPGGSDVRPVAFRSIDLLFLHYWNHIYELDVSSGELQPIVEGRDVSAMRISADHQFLYVGHEDGRFEIYRLPLPPQGHRAGATADSTVEAPGAHPTIEGEP